MKNLFDNFQTMLLPSIYVHTPLAIFIGEEGKESILKKGIIVTAADNTNFEWNHMFTPMNLHVFSSNGIINTNEHYLERVVEEKTATGKTLNSYEDKFVAKRAETFFFADENRKKLIATTDKDLLNTKGFQLLIKIDDEFINGFRNMYNHNIRTNDYLIK